jgi:hypothetical protein
MRRVDGDLEARIMDVLRSAREPVREAVLYERLGADDRPSPERVIETLERMATLGHLRVAVERDRRAADPPPFEPRFWDVVG